MPRGSGGRGGRPRHFLFFFLTLSPPLLPRPRPSSQSEYPAPCDARRAFISRFTGSAGTAVVTRDAALLWTDGRYFLQASQELGPEWVLMRSGEPGVPEPAAWLADHLAPGGRVGYDPWLHTVGAVREVEKALAGAAGGARAAVPLSSANLVDGVWGASRPPPPDAAMRVHPPEHAGEGVASKLARMRRQMAAKGAGALLVTALDEVAWLANTRGGDVPHVPVTVGYMIVGAAVAGDGGEEEAAAAAAAATAGGAAAAGPAVPAVDPATAAAVSAALGGSSAAFYVNPAKVTPAVAAHLAAAGIAVRPYEALAGDVRSVAAAGVVVWADPARVSAAVAAAARPPTTPSPAGSAKRRREGGGEGAAGAAAAEGSAAQPPHKPLLELPSPVVAAKALKNDAELAGMREAHLRDGVALAHTLAWLDGRAAQGGGFSEVEVDEVVTAARAAQAGFLEPSFPTIAGVDGNGAVIHYRAEAATAATAGPASMVLVDSGGQYECGTTDVTRTVCMAAAPTPHQAACFTRVLQGHIALDAAVFPEGTPGLALDAFARAPLWRAGLNYRHGTGHGVGAALAVPEGPQSISTRLGVHTPLDERMVVSIEPGYYEDGAFGIRIENLVAIGRADTPHAFGGHRYFRFERLTFAPLQKKLIDASLLTPVEAAWIDAYHAEVWAKVGPRVEDAGVKAWLEGACAPLAGGVTAA